MFMKLVNVGNALKVTCVGFAAGVLLRVVLMLYYFDYETSFYTDGGVMAWISLGVPLLMGVLAAWMCFRARRYFGPYVPRKNVLTGAAALLSGVVLLASAGMQWAEVATMLPGGEEWVLHLLFLVCCVLFGAVQIYVSVGFFTGKNNLGYFLFDPGVCVLRQVPLLCGEFLHHPRRSQHAAVPVLPVQAFGRGG